MKSVIIFAVPCEPNAEQIGNLVAFAENNFGGISSILTMSDGDLTPHKTEKPDYVKYFDNLCTVCEVDSFNKLLTVQKFWENVKANTPGFDKEHFSNFLNLYNTNEDMRKYVSSIHAGIVIRLISQAIEMM